MICNQPFLAFLQESMQHNKPVQDLDSSFSGDFRRLGGLTRSQHVEESIVLTVFGVDKPGKEIKEDLLEVLKSRLDEATLEMITLLLLRNPNCLLTPSDVQVKHSTPLTRPEQNSRASQKHSSFCAF